MALLKTIHGAIKCLHGGWRINAPTTLSKSLTGILRQSAQAFSFYRAHKKTVEKDNKTLTKA